MTSNQPNVLLVTMDQWPGKLMGAAGHPAVLTPTLDHLARLGTRYPRAYSECPVCIPARRTLMTGTAPRTHGDRVFLPAATMPNLPTLAQTFRDAGYQAYAVGKLHVYPQRDRVGFDDVLLAEEGRPHLGAIDESPRARWTTAWWACRTSCPRSSISPASRCRIRWMARRWWGRSGRC